MFVVLLSRLSAGQCSTIDSQTVGLSATQLIRRKAATTKPVCCGCQRPAAHLLMRLFYITLRTLPKCQETSAPMHTVVRRLLSALWRMPTVSISTRHQTDHSVQTTQTGQAATRGWSRVTTYGTVSWVGSTDNVTYIIHPLSFFQTPLSPTVLTLPGGLAADLTVDRLVRRFY